MSTYHHGNLRQALLDEAASISAESGPEAVRLREIARRLGVSHAAPSHHFHSRQELLTAVAVEGCRDLSRTLERSRGDIYDLGVDYVQWALANPGAYLVMWQPRLLQETDPELITSRESVWNHLAVTLKEAGEAGRVNAQAAFALVHGVSCLLLAGVPPLDQRSGEELRALLTRFCPVPASA